LKGNLGETGRKRKAYQCLGTDRKERGKMFGLIKARLPKSLKKRERRDPSSIAVKNRGAFTC
jgi:hypothetical protein